MSIATIPVAAAKRIAQSYGYDQVVVIARKVGEGGREHVTTYGVDRVNCGVAARIGDFLKHKVMGWPHEPSERAKLQLWRFMASAEISDADAPEVVVEKLQRAIDAAHQ